MKYALGNMLNGAGGLNPDGLALDLQFSADKTLTARKGPTPVFSRGSSGTFVNANGLIVGKTAGTTVSITPSTQAIGSQVTVTVASGSVVGWVVGQAISLIVDTDGQDDPDATELWLLGNIVSTTGTTLVFEVTSRTAQAGSATSWTLGYRVPRFDHTSAGVCRGLLIEESRTNLYSNSEDFSQVSWTKTRSSIQTNATTSPDGATTADKLIEDTSVSNTHFVQSAITPTATPHTLSVFAKKGERNFIVLRLGGANDFFNLNTGVALTNVNAPTITNYGNGWYRCTVTSSAGTQGSFRVSADGITDTYTGDGTSGIFIWGAQLEAGSFPTSYIPTTTASVVRSADVCSITAAAFNTIWNGTDITVLHKSVRQSPTTGSYWSLSSGTLATSVTADRGATTERLAANGIGIVSFAGLGANQSIRTAYAVKQGDYAGSLNGSAAVTSSSSHLPTFTSFQIGSSHLGSVTGFGWISEIRAYKKRLPNAKLVTLTT
jgi:hypothetical protein